MSVEQGTLSTAPAQVLLSKVAKLPVKIPLLPPERLKGDPVFTGLWNGWAGIGIISLPEAQACSALLFLSFSEG